MLLVQKYGGSSLNSLTRIRAAALRAAQTVWRGDRVVLVVSAQGDTTDEMIAKAAQIHPGASAREMDAYLSAGEQMSAGLMAMALESLGVEGVSFTGWQAGIHTDSTYGNAAITALEPEGILRELSAGRVPVVAGFQGVDGDGNITTLGRGGSDTTAVALAAALQAGRCQIFTDVDGVFDRDPRRFPDAVLLPRVSYAQMLRLIDGGAQVLHRPSVELARRFGTRVEVRSSFTGAPGTVVGALGELCPGTGKDIPKTAEKNLKIALDREDILW